MPVVNGKRYPYTEKGIKKAHRAYSRLLKKKEKQEAKSNDEVPSFQERQDRANEIRKKFPRQKRLIV